MKDQIENILKEHIQSLQQRGTLPDFPVPPISLQEPKAPEFGEYTSNIALVLARSAGQPPLELASILAEHIKSEQYTVEAVAPGYLNFRLSDETLKGVIASVLDQGKGYGNKTQALALKVNNEFISANPTGPLHVGNGRGGYFGDSLSRLWRKMGHNVTNEYYINDGGEQIAKLGHSVLKDEEAIYGGTYIDELHDLLSPTTISVEAAGAEAAARILEDSIKKTVSEKMGISYDVWTSEKMLLESGQVERALQVLKESGHTFEQDGAYWLRTTEFGDDKDRVLRKQDGSYTYFASDAGHILGYIEQGVDVIIETFGADHHGYTKRFEAVARALGFKGQIRFILMQLVQLEKDGAPFRMSKRAGNVVTIDDLVELVGKDVARFFFLLYSPDTHMTFDLGLAEERSQKNPVFYIQYAHARMASILEKAREYDFSSNLTQSFSHEKERALARELALFPEFLERAAKEYAPHRLAQYAIRLADLFHSFYGAVKVLDEKEKNTSENRLSLVLATKTVLAETLNLLGIEAPEKM